MGGEESGAGRRGPECARRRRRGPRVTRRPRHGACLTGDRPASARRWGWEPRQPWSSASSRWVTSPGQLSRDDHAQDLIGGSVRLVDGADELPVEHHADSIRQIEDVVDIVPRKESWPVGLTPNSLPPNPQPSSCPLSVGHGARPAHRGFRLRRARGEECKGLLGALPKFHWGGNLTLEPSPYQPEQDRSYHVLGRPFAQLPHSIDGTRTDECRVLIHAIVIWHSTTDNRHFAQLTMIASGVESASCKTPPGRSRLRSPASPTRTATDTTPARLMAASKL
jgi:hypothetical protein